MDGISTRAISIKATGQPARAMTGSMMPDDPERDAGEEAEADDDFGAEDYAFE